MPSSSITAAFFLLPVAISAMSYQCDNIIVQKQHFNLQALGGPKDVHWLQQKPPSISNTTFTIDLCNKLKVVKEHPELQCPSGTQICAIETDYNPSTPDPFIREVIPIAGEYPMGHGGHLEPKLTRLKDSSSNEDAKKEGLRMELHGGVYGTGKQEQKQKAVIEFLCDPDLEGTEGFDKDPKAAEATFARRVAEDEGGDTPSGEPLPDLDEGKSLQFLSYKTENDVGVLRLEWKTKYACEGQAEKTPPINKGSWGFFTWFLIIVFLFVAAYIIFGSWLNYNRYGARGWDLIPHGDAIRDIPYVVKDWTSGFTDRVKNGGNRGGYSAV
jgi:hypothetical protein